MSAHQQSVSEIPSPELQPPARFRVRFFHAANLWFHRLIAALLALHEGFWLSMLDHDDLNRLTQISYSRQPMYKQPEYNLKGLFDWEQTALEKYFSGSRTLLVGAAGAGREFIALLRQGKEVVAFECCPELVVQSRELLASQGMRGEVLLAEPDRVPDDLGSFDGIIIGWGAYSLIPSRGRRIGFLRECRAHLNAGGPILISFLLLPADDRQARWVRNIAKTVRSLRLDRSPCETGDRMIPDAHSSFLHQFTCDEITSELQQAGFRLVDFSDEPYAHCVAVCDKVDVPANGETGKSAQGESQLSQVS